MARRSRPPADPAKSAEEADRWFGLKEQALHELMRVAVTYNAELVGRESDDAERLGRLTDIEIQLRRCIDAYIDARKKVDQIHGELLKLSAVDDSRPRHLACRPADDAVLSSRRSSSAKLRETDVLPHARARCRFTQRYSDNGQSRWVVAACRRVVQSSEDNGRGQECAIYDDDNIGMLLDCLAGLGVDVVPFGDLERAVVK